MTPLTVILGLIVALSLGATTIILAGCMLSAQKNRTLYNTHTEQLQDASAYEADRTTALQH